MTNVSAVEKMAELMQQMEENSPRVAALQYFLKQVAEKVEEAEKRNAELEARCTALAAENAGLKSNLMFWDSEDPEAPYDNPGEIAEACSLNYNEEFVVQVAAKMPNRVYRVCESWEHECKVELVDGGEFETPATDAFLAEVRASGVEMAMEHMQSSGSLTFGDCYISLNDFADQLRKGVQS
ncbi:hypothetical protein [Enterobacter hormaechei]|uniref:hypothetical protein n=1 Tax=Enterobacter hormaechei TaxID=158836 RepID=UPI000F837278|nr:hypothetical protein [Enterobacter hormaechei]ELT5711989.1 hypothetical protein [Enterobacter hormaechei]MCM7539476.1 hypothetical protein [Enterobacter hormaechei]RTO06719.1 hypothetical protein EKN68_00365 [Enterobacter hormaechei]RTP17831.1 hypothetical protein EKN48_01055 [Enterobacter hormaechei]HEI8432261.1 hypothetical protein [Enterobacter hormaechei]